MPAANCRSLTWQVPGARVLQQQLSALQTSAARMQQHSRHPGLSAEAYSSLPLQICDSALLESLADRHTCVICHEDFVVGEKLQLLPACGHAYHCLCIGHWLRIKAACPLCNATVADPRHACGYS